jgi:hypothetical protein
LGKTEMRPRASRNRYLSQKLDQRGRSWRLKQ